MEKTMIKFIDGLKTNKKVLAFDEAATKQAIVMRIFSFLEWDIFDVDEVFPDFVAKSNSVDYALRVDNKSKVFVLVKKPSEELEGHEELTLDFAIQEKVDILVATNGITWWFYLASSEGAPEEQRFYTMSLTEDDPNDIALKIQDYLGKENISSGKATEAAKSVLQAQVQKNANASIPKAWNDILADPDKGLSELLLNITEEITGCRAETKAVERFLNENMNKWIVSDTPAKQPAPPKPKSVKKPQGKVPEKVKEDLAKKSKPVNYAGEAITAFSFGGNMYQVGSWDDMLMTLCDIFVTKHKGDFDKVLWLSGDKRSYFSNIESELRHPEKIKRTNIFVERNLSPNENVNTAMSMLNGFGYSNKDLTIVLKKK